MAAGAKFYVSGMSSKTRDFDPGESAEAALPARLVELIAENDRVVSY